MSPTNSCGPINQSTGPKLQSLQFARILWQLSPTNHDKSRTSIFRDMCMCCVVCNVWASFFLECSICLQFLIFNTLISVEREKAYACFGCYVTVWFRTRIGYVSVSVLYLSIFLSCWKLPYHRISYHIRIISNAHICIHTI